MQLGLRDYVPMKHFGDFEFGFALKDNDIGYYIEIVVVDHVNMRVRVLGKAWNLEDAISILTDSIKTGFYIDGLLFTGIPTPKTNELNAFHR